MVCTQYALAFSAILAMNGAAYAADATWLANPGSPDFNTAANWTPAAVPDGTATFGTSAVTAVTFSADTSLAAMQFNALGYGLDVGHKNLTFTGAGIATLSPANAPSLSDYNILEFDNASSAGNSVITARQDLFVNHILGSTTFRNTSTAGSAQITNAGGNGGDSGSVLSFFDSSSAGSASIVNKNTAQVAFWNSSTAGNATILNQGQAIAGILVPITFHDGSSAGNAIISGGYVQFYDNSTAGNATLQGAQIFFNDASSPGTATLQIDTLWENNFLPSSGIVGGQARAVLSNNAMLDFSGGGVTQMNLGSLEGAGTVAIGNSTLIVGGNNASTTFNGLICDRNEGTGCTQFRPGATTGNVEKVGSGTLTVNGAISLHGNLTISNGAVQVGSASADGALAGNVVDNALLVLSGPNSQTYAGAISGTGTLQKQGAGTWILTGANSYMGGTTVQAGALTVNGSLASAVAVNNGGTLKGTGSISSASIASGGVLAPGNSIGTLNLSGNVTFAPGSVYQAEINPAGQSDLINAATATLNGGTVQIVSAAGDYAPITIYHLLSTTSGVTGTFDSVVGGGDMVATLVYGSNTVDLQLLRSGTAFGTTYGTTPNQIAAGNALSAGTTVSTLYLQVAQLATNGGAVASTLGQLSGDIHASMRSAAIEDSRIIRGAVLDRMNGTADGIALWGTGFGGYGSVATDGNAAGLHHDSAGFLLGADMPLEGGFRLGLGGGYVANKASTTGHLSTMDGDSGHFIAYGGWQGDVIDVKLGVDLGWGDVQVARNVAVLSQIENSHQSQEIAQSFGEVGYRIIWDNAVVEPYVSGAHVVASSGAFSETGGIAGLSGNYKAESRTYGTLGTRASLNAVQLGGFDLLPRLDVGWQHAFESFKPGQSLAFQGTAQNFLVLGVPLERDAASVRAGFDLAVASGTLLSISYDGSFADRTQNNALRGGMAWRF